MTNINDELEARTIKILADILDVPPSSLNNSATQRDVENWDSVAIVNIVAAVEAEFGISIPIDDAAELTSVAKVIAVVKGAHGSKS
jgi:acyl carrier protein